MLVNGEEVQGHLTQWLESKTLGVSSTCHSTKHNVVGGENLLGFRVTRDGQTMKLSHVVWTPSSARAARRRALGYNETASASARVPAAALWGSRNATW